MHRIACQCAHIVNYYIAFLPSFILILIPKVIDLRIQSVVWSAAAAAAAEANGDTHINIDRNGNAHLTWRTGSRANTYLPKIKRRDGCDLSDDGIYVPQFFLFVFRRFLFFLLLSFGRLNFILDRSCSYHEHISPLFIYLRTSFFINKMWWILFLSFFRFHFPFSQQFASFVSFIDSFEQHKIIHQFTDFVVFSSAVAVCMDLSWFWCGGRSFLIFWKENKIKMRDERLFLFDMRFIYSYNVSNIFYFAYFRFGKLVCLSLGCISFRGVRHSF